MTQVRLAHTADLERHEHAALRDLLDAAFAGDITAHDHEHALGGVHVLVFDDNHLIAHGSVVLRRLLHGGRALRTGYVEAVAVRPDRQRQGHGSTVMTALERLIGRAYDLGALGSSDTALQFYRGRRWVPWRGALSCLTPTGIRPTPDEQGYVLVLPGAAALDLDGELTCDWRDGDVW